jgi:hypothetical protein
MGAVRITRNGEIKPVAGLTTVRTLAEAEALLWG